MSENPLDKQYLDSKLAVANIRRTKAALGREAAQDEAREVRTDIKEARLTLAGRITELDKGLQEVEKTDRNRDLQPTKHARHLELRKYPPLVEEFGNLVLRELRSRQTDVDNVYFRFIAEARSQLATDASEEEVREKAGELFFLTFGKKQPIGKVHLERGNFALIISPENSEDAKKIESRKSVGGHYLRRVFLSKGRSYDSCPLIFIKPGFDQLSTRDHERSHSIFDAVDYVFSWGDIKHNKSREVGEKLYGYLGGNPGLHWSSNSGETLLIWQEIFTSLKDISPNGRRENERAIRTVTKFLDAKAKDEMLAALYEGFDKVDWQSACLKKGEEGENYNYLQRLGIAVDKGIPPVVVKQIREEYCQDIDEAAKAVENFAETLGQFGGPELNRFLWALLMPEPLARWPKFLHRYLGEEMNLCREFFNDENYFEKYIGKLEMPTLSARVSRAMGIKTIVGPKTSACQSLKNKFGLLKRKIGYFANSTRLPDTTEIRSCILEMRKFDWILYDLLRK